MLCMTVRNLSSQMHEEFALERRNRHQDFGKMDQKMSDKVEEGVKSEQLAKGLKNEENARHKVQNDLAVPCWKE